jgi:putative ABC transport system ATP-binding protein
MINSNHPIITVNGLNKSYNVGGDKISVLKNINLEIFPGEFVVIFGPSGCGKSTLLNTIIGLEPPTTGHVKVQGRNIYNLDEDGKILFRQKNFGVVYQQSNWLKSLNVIENVAFSLDIIGNSHKRSLAQAKSSLTLAGIESHAKYKPTELSGGQQAKVAICRAIITNPPIILADEPTGNLDTASAISIMQRFEMLNREYKRTIVMVTHNPVYFEYATKIINMMDGKISSINVKDLIYKNDKTGKKDLFVDGVIK